MSPALTRERLSQLQQLSDDSTRDWPAVRDALNGYATMAYVHGARYSGPSIDFDALIKALPDLLSVVQGLFAPEIDDVLQPDDRFVNLLKAREADKLLRHVRALTEIP